MTIATIPGQQQATDRFLVPRNTEKEYTLALITAKTKEGRKFHVVEDVTKATGEQLAHLKSRFPNIQMEESIPNAATRFQAHRLMDNRLWSNILELSPEGIALVEAVESLKDPQPVDPVDMECALNLSGKSLGQVFVYAADHGLSTTNYIIGSHRFDQIDKEDLNRALKRATENGHAEVVKALITSKRFQDFSRHNLQQAFLYAVENGHAEVVQKVVASDRIKEIDFGKIEVKFLEAIYRRHADVIKILINDCPKFMDHLNLLFPSVLSESTVQGLTEVTKALINHPKFTNLHIGDIGYVLSLATEFGHKDIVDALLASETFSRIPEDLLYSAFLRAAMNRRKEVCITLLNSPRFNSSIYLINKIHSLLDSILAQEEKANRLSDDAKTPHPEVVNPQISDTSHQTSEESKNHPETSHLEAKHEHSKVANEHQIEETHPAQVPQTGYDNRTRRNRCNQAIGIVSAAVVGIAFALFQRYSTL